MKELTCLLHLEAINVFLENGVLFGPAKAANAGGVAVSAIRNGSKERGRISWTFEEVDAKLHEIMVNIYQNSMKKHLKNMAASGNLVVGSNIAGFLRVADAMIAQGII